MVTSLMAARLPRASAPPGFVGCDVPKREQQGCRTATERDRCAPSSPAPTAASLLPPVVALAAGKGMVTGHLVPRGTRRKCLEERPGALGGVDNGCE